MDRVRRVARRKILRLSATGSILVFLFFLLVSLQGYVRQADRLWLWHNNAWSDMSLFDGLSSAIDDFTLDVRKTAVDGWQKDIRASDQSWEVADGDVTWNSTASDFQAIDVNYQFGTYVRQREGDDVDDELGRFAQFITAIRRRFLVEESQTRSFSAYSNRMAEILRLDDNIKEAFPSLQIAWVYIASQNGTFVVWPGNSDLWRNSDVPYDPRTRPWYKTATGKSDDRQEIPESMGLTFLYDDFTSSISAVRTLYKKIPIARNKFYVVGIDFLAARPVTHPNDLYSLLTSTDSVWLILIVLPILVGSALLFSLSSIFGKFGHSVALYFTKRPLSDNEERPLIHGRIIQRLTHEVGGTSEFSVNETRDIEEKLGLVKQVGFVSKLFGVLSGGAKLVTEELERKRVAVKNIRSLKIESLSHRGSEVWAIVRQNIPTGLCPECYQSLVSLPESLKYDGLFALNHYSVGVDTKQMYPGDEDTFPPYILDEIARRPSTIGASDMSAGWRRISEPDLAPIPQQLEKYYEIQDCVTMFQDICSGRVECMDVFGLTSHAFSNSPVRAVCQPKYLEQLLALEENSALKPLSNALWIHRTIIFDTRDQLQETVDSYKTQVEHLLAGSPSRLKLWAFSLDMLGGELADYQGWDFAFVGEKDQRIVIASRVDDLLTYQPGGNLRGIVSWRKIDINYFEYLYSQISNSRVSVWSAATNG